MSVIEAITVVRYRVKDPPKGWRRRKLRGVKRLAYRDAAWAKIRARCKCVHVDEVGGVNVACRYHDKEYRAAAPTSPYDAWGDPTSGPEGPPTFDPPAIWNLPRSDEPGLWDYGRAVAFRLARFYAYLDAKPSPAKNEETDRE